MKKTELSASMEDYLEAIFQIVSTKKAVRAKEIADRLNVTRSSVTGALQTLSREGMINYEPYDVITLTDAGERAGRDVVSRHEALLDFFVSVLKVDVRNAESAACAMEHAVSREIVEKLVAFTREASGGKRLSEVKAKEKVKIVGIDGGKASESRLVGMGLMPGLVVTVVKNDMKGPVVLAIRQNRVALGRKMAQKVVVS